MMPDRENVIEALESCIKFPRRRGDKYLVSLEIRFVNSIIALLKEQEAVEPKWQNGEAYCGACEEMIVLNIGARFCHKCGRAVKWDA